MGITHEELNLAVAAYWGKKTEQFQHSQIAGAVGQGTAGSVRGGKHFDPIAELLRSFFLEAGYTEDEVEISRRSALTLPGYFRPSKTWDLVVTHQDFLVAAFELKALGGPSFGNNANNRVEEAVGSATDFRKSALASLYPGEKPWLGYFFMIEDREGSRRVVKDPVGPLDFDPVWKSTSYLERMRVFCERLQDEGLYDSVCFLATNDKGEPPIEPSKKCDWDHFSAAINARLEYLKHLGYPKR